MDPSNVVDEDTAALILQLQLQDAQDLSALANEGEATDAELALALYQDELQRTTTIIGDRKITKSIARACETDGALLNQTFAQEQAAARDRTAAYRLGGIHQPRLIEAAHPPATELDDEELERLSAFNTVASPGVRLIEYPENGGSSTAPIVYRRCIACQENTADHDLATVPCNHDYCRTCLCDLFRASLTDESLFPPRCCSEHITPLDEDVRILLSEDLIEGFRKKKVEFETKDRTYCSNHACAVFIHVQNAHESVACPECHTVTCTLCKAAGHIGDCPEDAGHKQLLEVARANNWQQCPSCKRMIELELGCNHITYA
jgi:hypothetical protein